jgi:hypothetical protein
MGPNYLVRHRRCPVVQFAGDWLKDSLDKLEADKTQEDLKRAVAVRMEEPLANEFGP